MRSEEGQRQFVNARVYTGDPARPWASSFTVADGVIAELDPPLATTAGAADLGGRLVLPGFVDAHNHHALAGLGELYEIALPVTGGVREILALVAAQAAECPPGEWIVGNGWSPLLLDELATAESRVLLDQVTAGRPTVLRDQSLHNRWVNSAALGAAGRAGSLGSGLLAEAEGLAVERVLAAARSRSAQMWSRASLTAIARLHSHGVTAFQDAGASLPLMRALHALDDDGLLRAWVVTCALANDPLFGADPIGWDLLHARTTTASRHHRPTFAKIFLDGIPPMRTAAFLEPYLGAPGQADQRGELTMSQEELVSWLRELAAADISVKVHCTGDAAVRATLDAIEAVRGEGHSRPRFHIAHGQYVEDGDIARLAALGVSAEISPYVWFPGVIPEALGTVLPAERAARLHPNRALWDAGVLICAGSDWPVSDSPNALHAIYGLVTRADPTGERAGRLWPEQALTLPEAIAVFTRNGAEAIGVDDVTGVLRPGRSADFVVLDGDIFAEPIEQLPSRQVAQTWFAGELVHER
ncbi:amidohydrolase [Nocardioides sp.]|uniref:amidohydrolase n=1 Tax=Nocardioides sp. TaxID=35761 RepID=UPI0039E40771